MTAQANATNTVAGDSSPTQEQTSFGSSICVTNLCKRIRGIDVLSNISLTVRAGATVGLAGANGSGKTMLMRAILGLIRPTSGTVSIDGKALGIDMAFPPSVGMLLEGPAFLSGRSGFDNLLMLASIRDVIGTQEVREAIANVGLDPDDRRPYRKYSLGMKQRLGIAAALMERPRLIVLDEPTNALDASGVELVKSLVRAEQERGATLVLACHAADILRELSDEIHFLAEGHHDGHEVVPRKKGEHHA